MFNALDLMLLFIQIYLTLFFRNFPKLIFTSFVFYLQVIGFITLFQGYQRVHISYLSIHVDR